MRYDEKWVQDQANKIRAQFGEHPGRLAVALARARYRSKVLANALLWMREVRGAELAQDLAAMASKVLRGDFQEGGEV